ncbi:hypothetical protein DY000_02024624 [Brassica cretica]|uniref:DNA polymerase III gamma subunit domain-containing protein n=1 Tax=Brassica cretica TaxID=69181 RepID=A0ABQ7EGE6_BRACR|nr:hypothetical protein DY000_02024624 [Brassica cretica]
MTTTSRATSSRILKEANGYIGEHLRNHIHLTNCIHLKNHMHNNNNSKQSPGLTNRSHLMRDLVLLQRSRSLRGPSASPRMKEDNKEGRNRRSVDQNVVKKASLRLTSSPPIVSCGGGGGGTSKVTPSDEKLDKSYRVEDENDAIVKTLSDQLLVDSDVRNGRNRRKHREKRRAITIRDKYEEEEGGQDMIRAPPRNGCGLPFNWSRIHHRGKTFLDIAGRSLSCGMSDSKGRKELADMPISSGSSSSLPLLVDNEEGWQHDYSGELGIFADDLVKSGKDSDFGERRSSRNARLHQSFTQKYTPRIFSDLVGQSLMVQALSNAVAKRRVGLLYVFHGPNGTGKTSCARVFARALNCHSMEQSKPCGVCSSCVSYDNGKNRNIREMGPVKSFDFESLFIKKRQKHHLVLIFDDCDTMSTDCWNALSKIVDRAPRRVVFLLVCSSLDVLPHVVVSRCQKFFFPKLKDADIVGSLQGVALKEEIEIDEDALKLVASRSDGSLRDAEMTLEQLSLLGTRISLPLVQEMVGLISDEKLVDLLDLALSADTVNTVKNLRVLMETGVEPLALMSQLATVITDVLAGSYDFTKEECKRKFFRRQPLSKEDMEKLRQALKTLSESEKQLRVSNDKVTWLTAALLQLAPDQRYLVPPSPCNNAAPRPSVEDIWLAVIENVRVNGLREFLYREGKIFSISIGSAPTVELMFNSPVTKLTAENFRDHILRAFEAVLGSPVTLAIRIESKKDLKNVSSSSSRSEIVELEDETESARRKDLEASQIQSIVRGKASLGQVIKQAEGNGWSKRKAMLIADKLEHENLRLEPSSRSLICWKASRSVRRKVIKYTT